MSKIYLNNRKLVEPLNLKRTDVSVRVIAHSLAQANRYTGHATWPYSVAQHSVLLARYVPEELKLAALFHDASEAIMNDVNAPVKRQLPDYQAFETAVQIRLFSFYGIPWEHMQMIHEYDQRICGDEMLVFFGDNCGIEPLGIEIVQWDWEYAKSQFIKTAMEIL